MVLQMEEIPPRPADFDGALCLFGLVDVGVATLRAALGSYGEITSCELSHSPPLVRFTTHEAALAVRSRAAAAAAGCRTEEEVTIAVSAALGLTCAGADTLYNERAYNGRGSAAARARLSLALLSPPLLPCPAFQPWQPASLPAHHLTPPCLVARPGHDAQGGAASRTR